MPLGMLAKDSMVNLAELVSDKGEGESVPSTLLPGNIPPGNDLMVQVLRNGDSGEVKTPEVSDVEGPVGDESVIKDDGESDHLEESSKMVGPLSEEKPSQHLEEQSGTIPSDDLRTQLSQSNTTAPTGTKDDAVSNTSNGSVASELSDDAKMAAAKAAGHYTGFSADYHDFENYAYHSSYGNYGDVAAGGNMVATHLDAPHREEVPWWCCFFPWITGEKMIEDDSSSMLDQEFAHNKFSVGEETSQKINGNIQRGSSGSSSKEDDEVSTSSDVFGEKLSDKDRQAVIARLRLAQPDTADVATPSQPTTHALDTPQNGSNGQQPKMKSILKRSSTTVTSSNNNLDKLSQSSRRQTSEQASKRRSLFPTYETKAPSEKKDLHPQFAPMARVVTIKSLKDMSEHEKAEIWWQKPDYEEFRRTGRMITKAMLEGGSEIWLATNQSWQMPNQGKAQTLQHAYSLADHHAAFQKGDLKAKRDYEDTRDKWWHKFGHSRRGLEHIASIDEGRQRQANVKTSIKAVLEEQRRQKAFHREDPEKLRMVSIQNTTWAKDLALASGASDADAVQKNFDDESRRTREFYLLKFSRTNQSINVSQSSKKVMPAFMKPMMTMQIPPNRLDANTMSQVRYRQARQQPEKTLQKRVVSDLPDLSSVPIRDDDDSHSNSTMAKKAAGFASGEEVGNMSAILTGMGGMGPPMSKTSTATVGGP
ncbi:hypothetical protein IV203_004065 [Nitzschia inconspicua]|uniref:Uncharacterized protein n=1 Tax=Nitzschia inconspicua TaxID=303405 RepID=A0A9K3L319_9STRA|nr:hypothetical protein IV203_004065 [Nitzschia inconspicua]